MAIDASRREKALGRMKAAALRQTARELVGRLFELTGDFENIVRRQRSLSLSKELRELQTIVKKCYSITTRDGQSSFWETLDAAGFNAPEWFSNKYIMQIDKLSAYHRIPGDIVREARRRKSRALFARMRPAYTEPYGSKMSSISSEKARVSCYVHAEVQLIVHYLLSPPFNPPRVIGASKAACFLCHSFIKGHGKFVVSAVHGRIFDQWTIPDLAEYSPEAVMVLRAAIAHINKACKRLAEVKHPNRGLPLTSRHNLRELREYSPTSSVLGDQDILALQQLAISGQDIPERNNPSAGVHHRGSASNISGSPIDRIPTSLPRVETSQGSIQEFLADSEGKRDRLENPRSMEIPNSKHTPESNPSSSTLCGQTTPEVRIESDKPYFMTGLNGVEVLIEIEAPGSGMVGHFPVSEDESSSRSGNVVRLEDLRVGQEMDFQRRDDENSVVIHLERGQSKICSLSLRWA